VYLAWGSTFFAIKVGVAHFSPSGLGAIRFSIASLLMLAAWGALRGARAVRPSVRQSLTAAGVGIVLVGGGNAGLAYAETTVPSSVCALVIGCSPMLFALFDRLAGGPALDRRQIFGGLFATAGVAVLALEGRAGPALAFPLSGLAVLFAGMVCWTGASVVSKRLSLPKDTLLTAGIQNLAASAAFLVVALGRGEMRLGDLAHLRADTWGAILYLAVVGSCIGFTAYAWLLAHEPIHRASSYAFVNPVVAVFLGTTFGGERLTPGIAGAIVLILAGVALAMLRDAQHDPPAASPPS